MKKPSEIIKDKVSKCDIPIYERSVLNAIIEYLDEQAEKNKDTIRLKKHLTQEDIEKGMDRLIKEKNTPKKTYTMNEIIELINSRPIYISNEKLMNDNETYYGFILLGILCKELTEYDKEN